MLTVQATPTGTRLNEFVRITLVAQDTNPGTLEIHYTLDGSVPDTFGSGTIIRRSSYLSLSPGFSTIEFSAKNIPLSQPTTVKFLARNITTLEITPVSIEFYDIIELTAVQEIRSVPEDVKNYTLKITNGDLARTTNGLFDIVFGIDKTAQDVREVISVENVPEGTAIGNRILPNWGSGLNRIFGSALPAVFTASLIQTEIYKALAELMRLQRIEAVPSDERIRDIVRVIVVPMNETDYSYDFEVTTSSGRVVNESGLIRGVS